MDLLGTRGEEGGAAPPLTTLYRQRIGLLAARASGAGAGAAADPREEPLRGSRQSALRSHHQGPLPSSSQLPSRQVAAHLFEYRSRHPGYAPASLVARLQAESSASFSSAAAILPSSSPRPTVDEALPPAAVAPCPSRPRSASRAGTAGPGKAGAAPPAAPPPPSYLPCCAGCGGALQPGDVLSAARLRLERPSPFLKAGRSARRRASRNQGKAKKRVASGRAAGDAGSSLEDGLSRIQSAEPSSRLAGADARTPSACKNYLVVTCAVCQSSYRVPGHSRDPHPLPSQRQQSRRPEGKRPRSAPTPSTARQSEGGRGRERTAMEPPPPPPAAPRDRPSEDYISLARPSPPLPLPLPLRVQPSGRKKKRKPSSSGGGGGQSKLMDFLSSLND